MAVSTSPFACCGQWPELCDSLRAALSDPDEECRADAVDVHARFFKEASSQQMAHLFCNLSADALHRIFFEMSEAQVANVSFFKLRGDDRHAADSLANYAAQGSRLAARMLARLPNATRAGAAASS